MTRQATARVAMGFSLLALAAVGCGGATDNRPAKWSYISALIVEPTCATVSCHSAVAQRNGVDLHSRDVGYRALLDRHFVFPGDSTKSSLMRLLRAEGSIRMPPDFPLPEADIDLIAKWIDMDNANND